MRNVLPTSHFGGAAPARKPVGYYEATIRKNNSRGKVVEDKGDELVIYLYASGETETVNRADVLIVWKDTRA